MVREGFSGLGETFVSEPGYDKVHRRPSYFSRIPQQSGRDVPGKEARLFSILDTIERWLSSRREARPEIEDTVSSSDTVDVDQERVDRILDKISEGGYESLTEEEKRILYEASKH